MLAVRHGAFESDAAESAWLQSAAQGDHERHGPFFAAWMPGRDVSVARQHDAVAIVVGRVLRPGGRPADGMPANGASAALAGYRRWGKEVLSRLRGAYVVLIWDRTRSEGILARDHLGGGALFYRAGRPGICLATEISPLIRLLPARPSPDPGQVARWLEDGTVSPGRTLYREIDRLPLGEFVHFTATDWSVQRYWSPEFDSVRTIPRDEAVSELREHVAGSIRARLPCSGQVGVLLSGGLDSSLVAAETAEVLTNDEGSRDRLRAYSAVFPEHPAMDESSFVRDLLPALGIECDTLEIRGAGSAVNAIADYVDRWGVPPSAPNHFLRPALLQRAAGAGAQAVLDGEGGDELFGPSLFVMADYLRTGDVRAAARLIAQFRHSDVPLARVTRRLLGDYGLRGALPYALHERLRRRGTRRPPPPAWLAPEVREDWCNASDPWVWKQRAGPRWWAYLAHVLVDTREELGVFDHFRRVAQVAGVESRHPLLDLDLVEWTLRLPPEVAIQATQDRPLARQAMKGLLPDVVRLRRAKADFAPLLAESLREDADRVQHYLLGPGAELGAFVRRHALEDHVGAARSGLSGGRLLQLFRWLAAELWLRSNNGRGSAVDAP